MLLKVYQAFSGSLAPRQVSWQISGKLEQFTFVNSHLKSLLALCLFWTFLSSDMKITALRQLQLSGNSEKDATFWVYHSPLSVNSDSRVSISKRDLEHLCSQPNPYVGVKQQLVSTMIVKYPPQFPPDPGSVPSPASVGLFCFRHKGLNTSVLRSNLWSIISALHRIILI